MQEQLPRDGVKARGSYISRRSSESWNSCLSGILKKLISII